MATDAVSAKTTELPSDKKAQKELSKEDLQVKNELMNLIDVLKSDDTSKHINALECLRKHCQSGATAMTILPRYVRFMFDKVEELKEIHTKWADDYEPAFDLANVISALSIISTNNLDCLNYRRIGRDDDIGDWGIEYVRHLTEEIRAEYEACNSKSPSYSSMTPSTISMVNKIASFYMRNNCEIDAIDLYLDVDLYDYLDELVTEANCDKVGKYLFNVANFSLKEDFEDIIELCGTIFFRFNRLTEALTVAARSMDVAFCHDIINKTPSLFLPKGESRAGEATVMQKQMCYMLAHFGFYYYTQELPEVDLRFEDDWKIQIIRNGWLSKIHHDLAAELDILKPHSPEDIHRINTQKLSAYYSAGYVSDPARLNLGNAFVSGLVNAAFKTDLLLMNDVSNKWLLTQKDMALMNCVACVGLLYLWDIDEALMKLDKFLSNSNRFVKAGAILAIGIASANVIDTFRSNLALLKEYVFCNDILFQKNAIMAIGLAYIGTDETEVITLLQTQLMCGTSDNQIRAYAALALGMVSCGTNPDSSFNFAFTDVLQDQKERLNLNDSFLRLIPLGLGLAHVGRIEAFGQEIKDLYHLPGEFGKWCRIMMKICINVGTGNPLAMQKLLYYILDPSKFTEAAQEVDFMNEVTKTLEETKDNSKVATAPETLKSPKKKEEKESDVIVQVLTSAGQQAKSEAPEEPKTEQPAKHKSDKKVTSEGKEHKSSSSKKESKRKDTYTELELTQGLATLGIAMISLYDEVNQKMALRLYNAFLQFGSIGVRRAVPVGIGILYASNPQVNIIELLSKLSHDPDSIISSNAILALGMVAAGTNNSRVGNILRNLNIYFYRDPVHLFAIRLAQGLLHLSKGVMSLSATRGDNGLLSPIVYSTLFIHGVLSLDVKNNFLSMDPHMFFWLVPAIKLRGVLTYDENMKMVPVTVRVGQPVDEVGQAGEPKRITSFQTNRTPILLNVGERVEVATDKYTPYTNIIEGVVIVKKNFDEDAEHL